MPALTADRKSKHTTSDDLTLPVAADTVIYSGALVGMNTSGFAVPGGTNATDVIVGFNFGERVDNTGGAAGAVDVDIKKGIAIFANSGANALTRAGHLGDPCYAEDDQTVGSSATGNPVAGTVHQVDADGVWVKFA